MRPEVKQLKYATLTCHASGELTWKVLGTNRLLHPRQCSARFIHLYFRSYSISIVLHQLKVINTIAIYLDKPSAYCCLLKILIVYICPLFSILGEL